MWPDPSRPNPGWQCKTRAFLPNGFSIGSILTWIEWFVWPFCREFIFDIICMSQGPSLLRCLTDPIGHYVAAIFISNFGHVKSR